MGNDKDKKADPQVEALKAEAIFNGYYKDVATNCSATLGSTAQRLGFSHEKLKKFLLDNRGKAKGNIASYLESKGIDTDGMKFPSYLFSKSEREAISRKAEENFILGYMEADFTTMTVERAVKRKELTEEEGNALFTSRDILTIMLKPGMGDEIERQNISTAKYLLGKDIDKTKLSNDEYSDIINRRYAEILNRRMAEILETDYNRFKHLTDRQLAENWEKYFKAMHSISIIKAEAEKMMKSNPYINKELVNRTLDVENDMGMLYFSDTGRMQAISSGYYSTVDTDFMSAGTDVEPSDIHADDNPELSRFMKGVETTMTSSIAVFDEEMNTYFRDRIEDFENGSIKYFSSKDGSELKSFRAFPEIKAEGSIIAVPEGHPELARVLNYDTKTLAITEADQTLKQYAAPLEAAKAGVTDVHTAEMEADRLALESCKALRKMNETVKTAGELASSLADDILASENYEMTRAAVLGYNKRHVSPYHPGMTYDQFTKTIGIKNEDKLGKKTVQARRNVSRTAFNSLIETELAKKEGVKFDDNIRQMIKDSGINEKTFTSVMCAPGKENLEANAQMVRDFFGYGPDNQKLDIPAEELNKKRNGLIRARLDQLAGLRASLGEKNLTDAEIAEKYPQIAELTNAGKEWKTFEKSMNEKPGCRLDEEISVKGRDESELAEIINDEYGSKIDYIASEYYQFGGEKELGSEKGALASIGSNDHGLRVSGLAMNRHVMQHNLGVCKEVLKSAGISPEDVDFVYDDKGKGYEGNRNSLGEVFKECKNVMLFKKGQKDPVMLNIGDIKKHPVAAETAAPSEADLAMAKMARFDMKMSRIENDPDLTAEQKRVQTDIAQNEYELGIIAESLKGLKGEQLDLYMDSLKSSMATYIARATADKYLSENPEANANMADEKHIADYAKELKASDSLDMLLDDMLDKENAFENIQADKLIEECGRIEKRLHPEKAIKAASRNLGLDEPQADNGKEKNHPEDPNLGSLSMGPR